MSLLRIQSHMKLSVHAKFHLVIQNIFKFQARWTKSSLESNKLGK